MHKSSRWIIKANNRERWDWGGGLGSAASVRSLNIILKAVESHQRGADQKQWCDPIYLKGLFARVWKICISVLPAWYQRALWEGREQGGGAGAGRVGQEGWDKGVLSLCSFSWFFRNHRAPCTEVKDIFHLAASKALVVGLLSLDIIFFFFLTLKNPILNLKIFTYSNVVVLPAIFLKVWMCPLRSKSAWISNELGGTI